MSKTGYFGRDGRLCQKVEWDRLRANKEYYMVRRFSNGVVNVALKWIGKQENVDQLFPDCYKLFVLHVWNYNELGIPISDPVESGRTFPTEKLAIEAYDKFLLAWTKSHIDEDGELIEEENEYTPPPKPNLDAPASSVSAIKGMKDIGGDVW
jgi:hypothetical protein